MDKEGHIQVYTGSGKGKTTAAFGLVLRAISYDWRILVVQFMKGDPKFSYGEIKSCERFKPLVKTYQVRIDVPVIIKMLKNDEDAYEECLRKTKKGWGWFINELEREEYDMVILDEVLPSLDNGILPLDSFKDYIKWRSDRKNPHELVLTGRMKKTDIITYIQDISGYFTKMKAIKHVDNKKCPCCGKIFIDNESTFNGCPECIVPLVTIKARRGIEY